VITAEELL